MVASGTFALGDAPLHPASETSEISTNSPYGEYESAKREFPKRRLCVIIGAINFMYNVSKGTPDINRLAETGMPSSVCPFTPSAPIRMDRFVFIASRPAD